MFKRILIAFITVCSFAMADSINKLDEYRIYVKAVDEESHVVALSNGLICNVVPSNWWLEKNLEVGDEVELSLNAWSVEQKDSFKKFGQFTLELRKDNTLRDIFVWISEESKKNGLIYVSDTTRIIQPAGWFFPEATQKIVELSDGSKWEVGENWKVKFSKRDLVIPVYNSTARVWLLISLDKLEIAKASEVEIDHIKGLVVFNKAIPVTPFKEDSNAP